MTTISLRLPDSLHRQIRKLANEDGISINQFISTAAAEKLAALLTVEYLEERAKFDAALASLPDGEPEDYDKR
jgi:hypothetical protein